jgi:hypothetical protein
MKNEVHRQRPVKDIDHYAWRIIAWALFGLLTLLAYRPALGWFDEWTSQLRNQVTIAIVLVFVTGPFLIYWNVKRRS